MSIDEKKVKGTLLKRMYLKPYFIVFTGNKLPRPTDKTGSGDAARRAHKGPMGKTQGQQGSAYGEGRVMKIKKDVPDLLRGTEWGGKNTFGDSGGEK